VRHLELSTEGSGLAFEPGDSLAVVPVNPPALDVSAGTGGDNPSSKAAKVTIIIKQPPL